MLESQCSSKHESSEKEYCRDYNQTGILLHNSKVVAESFIPTGVKNRIIMNKWQKHIFELTPLGKADKDVREFLKGRIDEDKVRRYESSLKHYRHMKAIQTALKMLLYASVITSVATTFGFEEVRFLQQVASYVGTSVLFILYAVTSYITMIRRESYHVQREILVSKAS
jgi:hypothetical protein